MKVNNSFDYKNSRDFIRGIAKISENVFVSKERFVTFRRDTPIFVNIHQLCNTKDRNVWLEQEELNYMQAKDIYYVNSFPKDKEYAHAMLGRIFTEVQIEKEIEDKTTMGFSIINSVIQYNIFLEELFYLDKLIFY